MKVKVTRTVEFDEVPNLINKIVDECQNELRSCSGFKFNLFDMQKTRAEVGRLQKTLDLMSDKLEDCIQLGSGYVENMARRTAQAMGEGVEATDDPDPPEEVEDA